MRCLYGILLSHLSQHRPCDNHYFEPYILQVGLLEGTHGSAAKSSAARGKSPLQILGLSELSLQRANDIIGE
jgi:hypothetical protein